MKNSHIKLLLSAGFLIVSIASFSWGSWGHRHISHAAVFSLPAQMRGFYYNHIDFITESAVVPDLRKSLLNDRDEGPRHYMDVELFKGIALDEFPLTTKETYQKYDSSFLNHTGYLPWYIQNLSDKLTRAFQNKNKSEILFLSAEISHYIADAYMPLHTSENHNGQLTGQTGVHSLWESVLPPMFGNAYNFNTREAEYIESIPKRTMEIIKQSHSQVPALLAAEKRVRNRHTTETMYKRDKEGNLVKRYNNPVFSDEYASDFHSELQGMVESQLRLAIREIGNFWYTCWVNGGKPDLSNLDNKDLTRRNKKWLHKSYKSWQKGKLLYMN